MLLAEKPVPPENKCFSIDFIKFLTQLRTSPLFRLILNYAQPNASNKFIVSYLCYSISYQHLTYRAQMLNKLFKKNLIITFARYS